MDRDALVQSISARQRMVLQLRSDGYDLKQIAHVMNISYTTAYTHLGRLKKHIGITTDEALLQYALKLGLSTRTGSGQPAETQLPLRKRVVRRKR